VPQQRALEQGGDVAPHVTLASLTCPVAHVPVHCVHGMGRGAATARRPLGECDGQYKTRATKSSTLVNSDTNGEQELYTGSLALSCPMYACASVVVHACHKHAHWYSPLVVWPSVR
jgi:hypothetical protein